MAHWLIPTSGSCQRSESCRHNNYVVCPVQATKVVIRVGVGYDNVSLRDAGALGIPVCNVPNYGTEEARRKQR
jgi:lactate dehydrogenase-like 2-hydroxyacid dehydrogenase